MADHCWSTPMMQCQSIVMTPLMICHKRAPRSVWQTDRQKYSLRPISHCLQSNMDTYIIFDTLSTKLVKMLVIHKIVYLVKRATSSSFSVWSGVMIIRPCRHSINLLHSSRSRVSLVIRSMLSLIHFVMLLLYDVFGLPRLRFPLTFPWITHFTSSHPPSLIVRPK